MATWKGVFNIRHSYIHTDSINKYFTWKNKVHINLSIYTFNFSSYNFIAVKSMYSSIVTLCIILLHKFIQF